MRFPKYLSPTSIRTFYTDRREYYLRYLADNQPPKIPQTRPMAVGSAFDAYLKAHIAKCLFGTSAKPEYDFESMFEKMVEPQNRDWARDAGRYVFGSYLVSGAIANLMLLLEFSTTEPKMEFRVEGKLKSHKTHLGDIPVIGIPDVYFTTKTGHLVIMDFKVTGFCSNSPTSPPKGYLLCLDGWNTSEHSRAHNMRHKDVWPEFKGGLEIDKTYCLEELKPDWAEQLSMYAWLLDAEIGSDFIVAIENICGNPETRLRVASYRNHVSKAYQDDYYNRINIMWDTLHSGHIFTDMSREESIEMQRTLEDYHMGLAGETEADAWFRGATRM